MRLGDLARVADAQPHRPGDPLPGRLHGRPGRDAIDRDTAREMDDALEVSGASALLVHAERAGDVAASRLAGGLPRGTVWYERRRRRRRSRTPPRPRLRQVPVHRTRRRRPRSSSTSGIPCRGCRPHRREPRLCFASARPPSSSTRRRRLPAGIVDVAHGAVMRPARRFSSGARVAVARGDGATIKV